MITIHTIDDTLERMKTMYLQNDMPWVVGWSGGKDSTTVLQLTVYMLLSLRPEDRTKKVHVVSSDTLVEAPYIADYVDRNLERLQQESEKLGLPIVVKKVTPEIEESFFVNLIGKGYPAPNRWFRWCTERLKINPVTRYIEQQVSAAGRVLIILGARKSESASRGQVMTNRQVAGTNLRTHATIANAFIYAPIEDWETDDVWRYLTAYPSPWKGNNRELRNLYREANGGECPLVIDESTPSCGNSRFGCWVCTVITDDRSMQGFIESGQTQMLPMLNFRNWLKVLRDDPQARETKRRNGQEGLGPFTLETRQEILRRLLEAQDKSGYTLIRNDELELIRSHWIHDGLSGDTVENVYEMIYPGEDGELCVKDRDRMEKELLSEVVRHHGLKEQVIEQLVDVERRQAHKLRRHGIIEDIDEVITKAALKGD